MNNFFLFIVLIYELTINVTRKLRKSNPHTSTTTTKD